MKVALCLFGVVGNLYTDKDNRIWTQDVDYRIGLEHYRRRLFSVNDAEFDVFIHSWSTSYEQQLCRDYRPKRWLFEPQVDFEPLVRHENAISPSLNGRTAMGSNRRSFPNQRQGTLF